MRRPLEDLLATDDPAWPLVTEWVRSAANPVEILPPAANAGDDLSALQVTVRSPLGAIVHHSGGLLIDHGWVRLLGSHHPRMGRSLVSWNGSCGLESADTPPPLLLVGDDVLGGLFALDGGRLGGRAGDAFYFAPDALAWEPLDRGYAGLVQFLLDGDLRRFYGDRWPGWEQDVASLPGDRGFSIYPFLFTRGPSLAERSRAAAPLMELVGLSGALSP